MLHSEPSQSSTTLVISSLPPAYTSDSLSALLSSVGPIRTAFIVTSSIGEAKKSKGYGFAKFVLKGDAERAIEVLGGSLVDGRRIAVHWAKRRHRGDGRVPAVRLEAVEGSILRDNSSSDEGETAPYTGVPSPAATSLIDKTDKNAYAIRRDAKKAARVAQAKAEGASVSAYAINNARDSRTTILEGGLDYAIPEHKKALHNRLKKLVLGINTGYGSLQVSDISMSSATPQTDSNLDPGQIGRVQQPIVYLECPTAKLANEIELKIHNTVIKGTLVRAKNKFENDLIGRKGREKGGGRLIIRNLNFEVRSIPKCLDLIPAHCLDFR